MSEIRLKCSSDTYRMYFRKLLELASAPYTFPFASAATPSTVVTGLSCGSEGSS